MDHAGSTAALQRRVLALTVRQLRVARAHYEASLDDPPLLPVPAARVWLAIVNAEIAARLGHRAHGKVALPAE
jgi:hypothetical protein